MNVTSDTKAIILLTAPLIRKGGGLTVKSLSLTEYNNFATRLHNSNASPKDLLNTNAQLLLDRVALPQQHHRIQQLLARGFVMAQVLQEWFARGIWVISRADKSYPKRLRAALKSHAPPIIYGCGDPSLLDRGGLSIVGSRNTLDTTLNFTTAVGERCAAAGRQVISGGAKGVDISAMRGGLNAGGTAVGVLAKDLARSVVMKENRIAIADGRLTLISAVDPNARFNVGNAMARNKYIYALSDAGLVVNATAKSGGTWAGAVEQIENYKFVPVYVRQAEDADAGNAALLKLGAHVWPNPQDADSMRHLLENAPEALNTLGAPTSKAELAEAPSLFSSAPTSKSTESTKSVTAAKDKTTDPAFILQQAARRAILTATATPQDADALKELLQVHKTQLNAWLKQFAKLGDVTAVPNTEPVKYQATVAQ